MTLALYLWPPTWLMNTTLAPPGRRSEWSRHRCAARRCFSNSRDRIGALMPQRASRWRCEQISIRNACGHGRAFSVVGIDVSACVVVVVGGDGGSAGAMASAASGVLLVGPGLM